MTTDEAKRKAGRIPELIKDNLELCGMSELELSAELEVWPNHVRKWVRGKSMPSLSSALAMARTFGISVELLAWGEEAYE